MSCWHRLSVSLYFCLQDSAAVFFGPFGSTGTTSGVASSGCRRRVGPRGGVHSAVSVTIFGHHFINQSFHSSFTTFSSPTNFHTDGHSEYERQLTVQWVVGFFPVVELKRSPSWRPHCCRASAQAYNEGLFLVSQVWVMFLFHIWESHKYVQCIFKFEWLTWKIIYSSCYIKSCFYL